MARKRFYWKLRESELLLGERTLVMGVLNITPDSFSDGGKFNDPDRAYARALELEEQGADIIDIGAESTKPGSTRISADEEWQRLVPVLKALAGKLSTPISIDTYKSEIAQRALEHGAQIINDPSGLTFDPEIAKVAANGNAGLILNHMRGQPETWAKLGPMQNAPLTIARELEATANRARHAGVDRSRIVVDPGLGFGKRKEQNAEILAHLEQLAALEYPILVGASRKSFLAKGTDTETLFATAAAVTAAVMKGAHIVRVHDVKEMRSVVQVADEIATAEMAQPVEKEERPKQRRTQSGPYFEAERPRPTRAPLAKREAPPAPPQEEFRPAAADRPERPEAPAERSFERKPYPPREKRDGSAPPKRRFEEKREFRKDDRPRGERSERPSGFRKDDRPREFRKDDRPGGFRRSGPPKGEGFQRSGPRKPFDRSGPPRGDRPPRTGDRPPRTGDRPPRGDSRPPRSGDRPPRSGDRPPRSGPPRGDSRPPGGKRPFRKRP